MPEFLNYYGKLFEQSKIMERIMPRQVDNAQLKEHFPFLFSDYNQSQFKTADVVGVNKVPISFMINIFHIRVYLSRFMT